ncbi:ER membrane glycoprotein subunit of the GPI transamidase complex-like protein [Lobaria immixta]|nr:ER membrane glycoprotein subunit of the GPI transamidase complex-like protein [Lobaria immixta]
MELGTQTRNHPRVSLMIGFILWKVLLAAIALASPGPGYDTSTTILKREHGEGAVKALSGMRNFVRWDAIYFTQIAHRGVVFEQEWAFGWGFAKLLTMVGRVLESTGTFRQLDVEALAGLLLSHGFHLLSCLMLYQLTRTIYPDMSDFTRYKFALITAGLHIVSPAGLFLSAPYAESSFSFFNFTGFYLYAKSLDEHSRGRAGKRDALVVMSGLVFGIATTLRGNGLLSGVLYCFEALRELNRPPYFTDLRRKSRRLGFVVIGGGLMGMCAGLPQQVGFLKYWTFSNLPLFALATPMLLMMMISSLEVWIWNSKTKVERMKNKQDKNRGANPDVGLFQCQGIVQYLAIPQMLLAVLALTTYHVQIITRLSSGYPVWYWWLASMIVENRGLHLLGREWKMAGLIVRWMIAYALIQGGLFASFLPPA